MAFLRTQLMQTCRDRIWAHHTFPSQMTEIPTNTTVYTPSSTDGPMAWEFHKGLTVESGALLTPSNRCKGLALVINGDLNVNGTISMTARGAVAAGDDLALDYKNADVLLNPSTLDDYEYTIGSSGGAGGANRYNSGTGYSGQVAENYGCGGGGAGGAHEDFGGSCRGGAGSRGTSYSGGSGGGGSYANAATRYGGNASGNGANGGNGSTSHSNRGAGGGAGNPRGSASNVSNTAQNGTGGLLVVFVHGDINIGASGIISANGMNGGNGEVYGGGGGGSGGGSINIFYTGSITNDGSIVASGGIRGSSSRPGGYGGAGTVRIEKVSL